MMNIKEIMKILPHRYPFLLVDRVLEITDDEVVAIKNVTMNEPFFAGHFPGEPIMPGVLIVEAMAQASGVLAVKKAGLEDPIILFMGIDNCKFRRPVTPGDTLTFRCRIARQKGKIAKLECKAFVGDELACQADLMATVMERQ